MQVQSYCGDYEMNPLGEHLLRSLIVLVLSLEFMPRVCRSLIRGGHTLAVTAAQIAKALRTTVNVTDHNKPATFEGVTLAALLAVAGTPLNDRMRSTASTGPVGCGDRRLRSCLRPGRN